MSTALFPFVLAAGLLAPGWLLGRALGTPAGWAGAFLGSAALLFNLILALDALGVPLDLPGIGAGLAAVCLLLVWIARRRSARRPETAGAAVAGHERIATRSALLWLVPAFIALGAIALRAILEPLSGWDTYFRWDFLAQEMLRERSLYFYPPQTAGDYLHYAWCDGIAPLVSSLYAWAYLALGRSAAWATTPIVIAQALLLYHLVWRLAATRGGAVAGGLACALMSTSAVLTWGIAMGQETGVTALALAATFWFLERHRAEPDARWLVWAGLAAGVGALAREYGFLLIALGAAALMWWRTPRRGLVEFCAVACAVALPWYYRNLLITGNPLWPHPLGGLLPGDAVQAEYIRIVASIHGLGVAPHTAPAALACTVAIAAGVPLLLGVIGGVCRWRDDLPWLGALLAIFAFWLWSSGHTSGGLLYSLRVLTPAIAIGAALGAAWLARVAVRRHGWALALGLALASAEAGIRGLYLPVDLLPKWWTLPPLAWRELGEVVASWRTHPSARAIADAAGGHLILVSDPGDYVTLLRHGAKPVPFYSPGVQFLFVANTDFLRCRQRLRAAGFRFILLSRGNNFLEAQFSAYSFFSDLRARLPAVKGKPFDIYDLYAPLRPPTPR